MKNILKIFGIILLIIALTIIEVTIWRYFNYTNDNLTENEIAIENEIEKDILEKSVTKKLIVVKVEEKSLKTMDYNESLYIVSVKNEDMSKFNQGQEILVYYDGIVETSYPGGITADKIEILKEESDIEIPTKVLRHYNYSQKNISIEVKEISNIGIVFEITDLNKIPLDYGSYYEYSIIKKNVENEEYNQNLEFDDDAYTPPVTTNTYTTTSSYAPDTNRLKTVWEEVELIGNENYKNCDWEIISEEGLKLIGRSDWTDLYGELGKGEYEFKAYRKPTEDDSFFRCVSINFSVDEFGKVTNEETEFGW